MLNLINATAATPKPRLLYPRDEAAYQLGISIRALDYLIANQDIAIKRIGGRVLIPAKALIAFAKSGSESNIVR